MQIRETHGRAWLLKAEFLHVGIILKPFLGVTFCWLVAGWLVGLLIGWLVGWSVGQSVSQTFEMHNMADSDIKISFIKMFPILDMLLNTG